jgi:predicted esterase
MIKRANPITYVGASTPPIFMMHGTADCVVPNAQTTLLKQAMDAAGRCALKRNVVGAGHGGPEWTSQPAQDTLAPFSQCSLEAISESLAVSAHATPYLGMLHI